MNKHSKTYFLVGLVIIVWIGVAYRMFSYLTPHKENNNYLKNKSSQSLSLKKVEKRLLDTNKICYRNPFKRNAEKLINKKRNIEEKKHLLLIEESLPIQVFYLGFVKSKNSSFFSISINSKHYLIKRGEKIEGLELLYGDAQSIRVSYNSKMFTVQR